MLKKRRVFEQLEKRELLDASDLVISEFLAVNDRGLEDEDGDNSDWMEILNTGRESVQLEGLVLSDGDSKWKFPTRELGPADSIVVFASSKNRVGEELHANFKLSSLGERLSLFQADGETVIHEYNSYPLQTADISYGIEMSSGEGEVLLPSRVDARYLVPTNGDLGRTWIQVDFDDSSWDAGETGIGYERSGTNYAPLLRSRVPEGTVGFYSRIRFDTEDLGPISQLTLNMRYDDGFVAYLNGRRVASGNGPTNPQYNSESTGERSDGDAVVFEPYDISRSKDDLLPTGNVLAIHALNRNASSSDLLMMPELRYARAGEVQIDEVGFFTSPTPGGTNGMPVPGFVTPVEFDLPHGFYDTPQLLAMTTADPDATIRYTTGWLRSYGSYGHALFVAHND